MTFMMQQKSDILFSGLPPSMDIWDGWYLCLTEIDSLDTCWTYFMAFMKVMNSQL